MYGRGFFVKHHYRKQASDPLPKEHYWKQLMDARLFFVKRRYEHEFKWKPGRKMEEGIVAAILDSAQGQVLLNPASNNPSRATPEKTGISRE